MKYESIKVWIYIYGWFLIFFYSVEMFANDYVRTIALALFIPLLLILGVNIFSLGDPVQVTFQILLELLFFT